MARRFSDLPLIPIPAGNDELLLVRNGLPNRTTAANVGGTGQLAAVVEAKNQAVAAASQAAIDRQAVATDATAVADSRSVVSAHRTAVETARSEVEFDRQEVASNTGAAQNAASASVSAANTAAQNAQQTGVDRGVVQQFRQDVEGDRAEVAANKTAVQTFRDQASVSAAGAAASQADALNSAVLSSQHRAATQAMRDESQGFRDQAAISATGAGTSASAAQVARDQSQASASGSAASAAAALTSETKAHDWAEKPEDVPVQPGEFSALHHARKAEDQQQAATAQANTATTKAGEALAARDQIINELALVKAALPTMSRSAAASQSLPGPVSGTRQYTTLALATENFTASLDGDAITYSAANKQFTVLAGAVVEIKASVQFQATPGGSTGSTRYVRAIARNPANASDLAVLGETQDTPGTGTENVLLSVDAKPTSGWLIEIQASHNAVAIVGGAGTALNATAATASLSLQVGLKGTGGAPLSTVAPLPLGVAAVGTSADAARSDHIHAHGNLPGGAAHALATATEAGFLSPAEKAQLALLASAAVYPVLPGETGVEVPSVPYGNVLRYGAGSSLPDNSAAFQRACDAALALGLGEFTIPRLAAPYLFTKPVFCRDGVRWRGIGGKPTLRMNLVHAEGYPTTMPGGIVYAGNYMPDGTDDIVFDAASRAAPQPPVQPYSDAVLGTPDLVSYYRLGETTGDFADSGPAGQPGIPSGNLLRGADSVISAASAQGDLALAGAGTNGEVLLGTQTAFAGVAPFSAEIWVKSGFVEQNGIGLYSQNYFSGLGWTLSLADIVGVALARLRRIGGADVYAPFDYDGLGRVHLVGTYDGATSVLYVNGVELLRSAPGVPNGAIASGGPARVTQFGHPTHGADEVALYSRALTPAEVASHYSAGNAAEAPPLSSKELAYTPGHYDFQVGDYVLITSEQSFTFGANGGTFREPYFLRLNEVIARVGNTLTLKHAIDEAVDGVGAPLVYRISSMDNCGPVDRAGVPWFVWKNAGMSNLRFETHNVWNMGPGSAMYQCENDDLEFAGFGFLYLNTIQHTHFRKLRGTWKVTALEFSFCSYKAIAEDIVATFDPTLAVPEYAFRWIQLAENAKDCELREGVLDARGSRRSSADLVSLNNKGNKLKRFVIYMDDYASVPGKYLLVNLDVGRTNPTAPGIIRPEALQAEDVTVYGDNIIAFNLHGHSAGAVENGHNPDSGFSRCRYVNTAASAGSTAIRYASSSPRTYMDDVTAVYGALELISGPAPNPISAGRLRGVVTENGFVRFAGAVPYNKGSKANYGPRRLSDCLIWNAGQQRALMRAADKVLAEVPNRGAASISDPAALVWQADVTGLYKDNAGIDRPDCVELVYAVSSNYDSVNAPTPNTITLAIEVQRTVSDAPVRAILDSVAAIPAQTVRGRAVFNVANPIAFFRGFHAYALPGQPLAQNAFPGGEVVSRTFADGVTSLGSPTLTSATAVFTSADVGASVVGAGIPANTVIQSVVNATTATMSRAATASATGVAVTLTEVVPINFETAYSVKFQMLVYGGSAAVPHLASKYLCVGYNTEKEVTL